MIDHQEALISFYINMIDSSKSGQINPLKALPFSSAKELIRKYMKNCNSQLTKDNHLISDIDLNEMIKEAKILMNEIYVLEG